MDDVMDWAISEGLHPSVCAFLGSSQSLGKSDTIYVDRAGWAAVSDVMSDTERSHEAQREAVISILGPVGAEHFHFFLTASQIIPRFEDIFAGRGAPLSPSDAAFLAGIGDGFVTGLAAKLRNRLDRLKQSWGSEWEQSDAYAEWQVEADNALNYVVQNMQIEYHVLFMQRTLAFLALLADRKVWKAKLNEFSALVN